MIVDVRFCVTHIKCLNRRDHSKVTLLYNQSCQVREDTHLFVPTVLLRGNQNVMKGSQVRSRRGSCSVVAVASFSNTRYITDE